MIKPSRQENTGSGSHIYRWTWNGRLTTLQIPVCQSATFSRSRQGFAGSVTEYCNLEGRYIKLL